MQWSKASCKRSHVHVYGGSCPTVLRKCELHEPVKPVTDVSGAVEAKADWFNGKVTPGLRTLLKHAKLQQFQSSVMLQL